MGCACLNYGTKTLPSYIKDSQHKKLYIGETGRRLADRFREYLCDVERNDKDTSKPVARHLDIPNHSKQQFMFFPYI